MNTGFRIVFVLLGGLLGFAGCRPRERAPSPSTLQPAEAPTAQVFQVPSLNSPGEQLDLQSFRGQVVLLDFWATWCPPCRSELPALERLYQDLKEQGFMLIGLSVDRGSVERVREAVSRFSLSYPQGLAGPEIQQAYGGIRAVPTKFLLDRKGNVRQRYLGVVPDQQLRADIAALLAEPTPSAAANQL